METSAPLEAMRLAYEAAGKYTLIVSVGGDGTLHEIVNGLLRLPQTRMKPQPWLSSRWAMGMTLPKMIPREAPVGGRTYGWRTAVEKIARGQTKLFDAGKLVIRNSDTQLGGPQYFLNGMDVGFGAHAILNFSTNPKFLKGLPGYLAAILKTMLDYPALHLRIQIDDLPPFEQLASMLAITNGRCFGNGFWVCPQALADDGLFDLMLGDRISRFRILQLIPKFTKGTHLKEPEAHLYQARRVVLKLELLWLWRPMGRSSIVRRTTWKWISCPG